MIPTHELLQHREYNTWILQEQIQYSAGEDAPNLVVGRRGLFGEEDAEGEELVGFPLELAAHLTINPDFAVMPDEQALLA